MWNPTPSWDERLDELTKYRAKHGDCKVPESQGSLGRWVSRQREVYKKGTLSKERVQRLDNIGFSWATLPWDESRDELTKYTADESTCDDSAREF